MRGLTKALGSAAGLVFVLTIADYIFVGSKLLFYLLFPGLATALLITGGHGGSRFEEAIAPIAGFAVNTLIYLLATLCLVVTLRARDGAS